MLVGQDIEDLLFQLVGSHMIAVLGGADEVVAHFFFLSAVSGVLGTVGLEGGGTSKNQAWIGNSIEQFPQNYLKFGVFVHVLCSLSVQDEFGFIGNSHYVILHGVAQESDRVGTEHNTQPQITIVLPEKG